MFIETNKLYCRDNLKLMKDLPSKSIDLIYCDILYGTGRDFGDYKDLPADKDKIEEFYYPRVREIHRLLKNTGSIYLQMDTRINHWLRVILDNVFGYNNFRNEIIWSYRNGGTTDKKFNNKHDNILFYSKTDGYKFNPTKEKSYTKSKSRKPGIVNYGGKKVKFFKDELGVYTWVKAKDVWNIPYINSQANERVDYQTQKPKKLLERIIKASSDKGDIVADFFMGSGTTIVVAEELDRKWIGCDINQKAINITKERLSYLQKRLFV